VCYRFSKSETRCRRGFYILGVGILLFCIGAVPYLLINALPRYGWVQSRHLLTCAFGGVVIVFALVSLLSNMSRTYDRMFLKLGVGFMLYFSLINLDGQLILHAHSVIDRSIVQTIQANRDQLPDPIHQSILVFDRGVPFPFDEEYRPYEWHGFLSQLFDPQPYLAYSASPYLDIEKDFLYQQSLLNKPWFQTLFLYDGFKAETATVKSITRIRFEPEMPSTYFSQEKTRYRTTNDGLTIGPVNRVVLFVKNQLRPVTLPFSMERLPEKFYPGSSPVP